MPYREVTEFFVRITST